MLQKVGKRLPGTREARQEFEWIFGAQACVDSGTSPSGVVASPFRHADHRKRSTVRSAVTGEGPALNWGARRWLRRFQRIADHNRQVKRKRNSSSPPVLEGCRIAQAGHGHPANNDRVIDRRWKTWKSLRRPPTGKRPRRVPVRPASSGLANTKRSVRSIDGSPRLIIRAHQYGLPSLG